MKHITKATSIFLCLFLLLPLVGCGQTEPDEPQTDAVIESAEPIETDPPEPTVADLITETYSGNNYNGYSFRILGDEYVTTEVAENLSEIWTEEQNGEPLNDAVFTRNQMTEELLNVTITPVYGTDIANTLSNAVSSGSDDFDVALDSMFIFGAHLQKGQLMNYYRVETMDVTNPWWDKNIVDTFTLFGNKLYFITGDINFMDDYAACVIYFNKDLCLAHQLEYPYQDVLNGTWTIDKFYNMSKAVEEDLNGDGVLEVRTDVVGHIEINEHIKHWIYPMGEKSIDIAEDGSLSLQILTERQVDAINILFQYMVEGNMTYTDESRPGNGFIIGNALFMHNTLGVLNMLRDMENAFGVIPPPKMNEEQEHYGEYVSNGWTTAYVIPVTNKDPARTGTIMEVLCGYSTDTVRSALYDVLFASKLVRDEESVAMLDIIFASKSYDWAVDFSWGGEFNMMYNTIYNIRNNVYVSRAEGKEKALTRTIELLIEKIKAMD